MAQSRGVRLKKSHRDAVEDMVDNRGIADNGNEAIQLLLDSGMRDYGYRNGENGETTLKWLTGEFARAFTWIGIAWVTLTLFLPVGFRLGAIAAFGGAAVFTAAFHVLDKREPGVSRQIVRLLGGEKA